MKLILSGDVIEAQSTYAEKDIIKGAGFRWNPDKKIWWTDKKDKAAVLYQAAEGALRTELEAIFKSKQVAVAASRATDADPETDLDRPDGLNYLGYQRAGISLMMQREANLLADEMGLGKTIQIIGTINNDMQIISKFMSGGRVRILIIVPASLKLNWHRELAKWLTMDLSVGVAVGDHFPDTDIVVINYDILSRHSAAIKAVGEWDMVAADEAHYLKNAKAQRTVVVFGKWDKDPSKIVEPIKAKKRILATGTPILNKVAELFPLLNWLDPITWGSWQYFVKRYAAAYQEWTWTGKKNILTWNTDGHSNLDELQNRLREGMMVRRLKAEVLTELPAKRRQVIELPADSIAAKAVRDELEHNAAYAKVVAMLQAAVELAKVSDNPRDYQEAMLALNEGVKTYFTEMSSKRAATAKAKIPVVVEHLKDVLENGHKIIVFAHHKEVIKGICEAFPEISVHLTGDDSMPNRQAAVDAFQNDPNIKLFVGSIKAAGVGLTLTASAHVVFAELDWVPANLTQAEDRAHRIGQVNAVLVQHLVLEGSLDATMAHRIVAKQEVIDASLDIGAILEPVAVVLTATKDKKVRTIDTPVGVELSEVEKEAAKIGAEGIAAIHRGLKMLASVCDMAQELDGQGFNGADAFIGHALANSARLSAKQAVLGKKLVRKYRRQLPAELLTLAGVGETSASTVKSKRKSAASAGDTKA